MGDVINSKRPSEPESNAASSPLWVIEIDDDPKNKQTKKNRQKQKRNAPGRGSGRWSRAGRRRTWAPARAAATSRRGSRRSPSCSVPPLCDSKKKTPKNQNQLKTNRVSTLFWWVSQVDQASNRFWLVYFCNGCDSWFLGIQLGCHWVSLLIVFTGFNSSTRPLIGFDWFNFVMELSEFSMLLLVRFSKLKENDYQVVLGFTGFSNMTLGFMRFP